MTLPRRAPLSPDLLAVRETLLTLFPTLEAGPDWYGSIFFERKSARSYSANLKQTQIGDHVSMGAVLRIYDGHTLYEQATDDLSPEALKKLALSLVARVRGASRVGTTRPYRPVTWKERLTAHLEEEIVSQVDPTAGPRTPVHFGVRVEKDPTLVSDTGHLDRLKELVDRCKALAPEAGLSVQELTYVMARQNFAREESIFIDRETVMSQALFRLSLTALAMSGADRSFRRLGGLGGLETVEISDTDIREMLRDLRALKSAERMAPGRYRVLFGPELTGVLAHEAFGHSQEGDTCARGRSKAWELHRSGEKVGNSFATILNNPAIYRNGTDSYGAWGSYFFDEEGWLAQEQVLLEEGVLKPPMTNLTSALRLGVARTANGKRESWANGVYTRQTNTYFSAGDKTLHELMEGLGDGFLALHAAGGMEDPKGMGIQVGIAFLAEVKAGKLTGRVFKGPAGGEIQMTGYTPDILNSILGKSKIDCEATGPDTARHPFNDVGGCGKYHKEFVNAGCGGPYVLLDNVVLG